MGKSNDNQLICFTDAGTVEIPAVLFMLVLSPHCAAMATADWYMDYQNTSGQYAQEEHVRKAGRKEERKERKKKVHVTTKQS